MIRFCHSRFQPFKPRKAFGRKSVAFAGRPASNEGRIMIVIYARRDAVNAGHAVARFSRVDERRWSRTAKSCGPDAPTLASSLRKATFAGDGGNRARSPGRARRKPLKPLRGECRVIPV